MLLTTGCANTPAPTTQPVVASADFDKLWDASARVAEELKFTLDREDRRSGTITTAPLTGAQWFEPWRRELRTPNDVALNSLANIRRTLTIEIEPTTGVGGQKAFVATPKVLVERLSLAETRISNPAGYRAIYRRSDQFGTRETDAGMQVARSYWYPTGEDPRLAADVAERIRTRLKP